MYIEYVTCTFAVWRITHLLVAEDGPWDVLVKLRALLGDSALGRAMDCFYCSSVWVSLPFAFRVSDHWTGRLIGWLALSGAACVLEQATNRNDRSHSQPRKDDAST